MINIVEQRVTNVLNALSDVDYQKQFLTKPTAFSRKLSQKMSFDEMALFSLMNTGKSLSIELLEFFNGLPETRETITKQAFSKQRMFMDSTIFEDLNSKYIQAIYDDRMELFHGRLLIATDGSTAEIPNVEELREYFGAAKASSTSAQNARAGLNGFYDPLNHLMLKLVVDKYQKGDTSVFLENIDSIIEQYGATPLCFIFDRGYISLSLLLEFDKREAEYLFRVPSNCFIEELQSAKSNDEEIEIKITKSRLRNVDPEKHSEYLARGTIKVRLVKIALDSGEIEYLITNIPADDVPYEEMKAFYYQRWEIERCFNLLKNRLRIEDISARTPIGVRQEIQATVFLGNIIEDIAVTENKKLPQKEKNKHKYFVNVNLLCGYVKYYFLLMFYINGVSEEIRLYHYKRMIKFLRQTAISKNTGTNPRTKRVSRNKYKTNDRNSY